MRSREARARARRQWEVRKAVAQPRSSFEELELHTSDGSALRAVVDDPPSGQELRATLVLAHAMFATKSTFGRRTAPGLAASLSARGFRTIAFDFRGHGDSTTPDPAFGYDDLVRHDLPAVVEFARARAEDHHPVIVVGHSLGGHVTLAALGTGRTEVDAVVAVGANVWAPDVEPSTLRWRTKSTIARLALSATEHANLLARLAPALDVAARTFGVRPEDLGRRHVRDVLAVATKRRWASDDGEDYLAALARVEVPVAAVLGDRDLLLCHPAVGEAFARHCAGRVSTFHAPVGHMGLVRSPHAHGVVIDAVEWALGAIRRP